MEFWSKISAALKQEGFTAQQIRKLRQAFSQLDVAWWLRLSPDRLLPVMAANPRGISA